MPSILKMLRSKQTFFNEIFCSLKFLWLSRHKDAEDHFTKAGKPEEAINMYEHLGDYDSAKRVAKLYMKSSLPGILVN